MEEFVKMGNEELTDAFIKLLKEISLRDIEDIMIEKICG